jgi:hypothetical protein
MAEHIRNPIEWGFDQIKLATPTVGSLGRSVRGSEESRHAAMPAVRRIKAADLRDVLVRGLDDFAAYRRWRSGCTNDAIIGPSDRFTLRWRT